VHIKQRVWGLSCGDVRVTGRLRINARKFFTDVAGSTTVEFVIALPVLFAMLAFSVQYGNALKVRNNLDIASRDAARYLARAPLNAAKTDIDAVFKTRAEQIVANRVANTNSSISTFTPTSNETIATVAVTIDVPFPLLKWLGLFTSASPTLSMSSSESWARTGDAVVTTSTSSGS